MHYKEIAGRHLRFTVISGTIKVPGTYRPTLALGSELSNVACLADGNYVHFTSDNGDLSDPDNLVNLRREIDDLLSKTMVVPEIVAVDLHPQFESSRLGQELAERFGARLVKVQHHKAHIASVAAEHGLDKYRGIAMDGLGYGDDDGLWGGEVFDFDGDFSRIGHLEPQPQIGGDTAAQYPKKMLVGILNSFMKEDDIYALELFDRKELRVYLQMLADGFNTPLTTSTGRILDAASALLDVCDEKTADKTPSIELEKVSTNPLELRPVIEDGIVKTTPLFEYLVANRGGDTGRLAATAQSYIAQAMAAFVTTPTVISGGVVYNSIIAGHLISEGALINEKVPCGDAGICLGQVHISNILS